MSVIHVYLWITHSGIHYPCGQGHDAGQGLQWFIWFLLWQKLRVTIRFCLYHDGSWPNREFIIICIALDIPITCQLPRYHGSFDLVSEIQFHVNFTLRDCHEPVRRKTPASIFLWSFSNRSLIVHLSLNSKKKRRRHSYKWSKSPMTGMLNLEANNIKHKQPH